MGMVEDPRFAHLSARSTFSLRDGTIPPERLASAAAEAGMTHVALTDRDGVSGAVRFVRAAADAGITPVLGVDLALAVPSVSRRGPAAGARWREDDLSRVTLLALDEIGFGDLCRATSRAHANDRSTPHLRADVSRGAHGDLDLAAASGRVVAVLGVSSSVGRLLAQGRLDAAAVELAAWRERFGSDRVVLGVRDHRVAPGGRRSHGRQDPDEPGDDTRIRRTLELAERAGIVAVAVNDVRHERPDDAHIADVLRCIRLGVPLAEHHLGRTTSAAWLTDPATQLRRFRERPELLTAAADLAERCSPALEIGGLRAPRLTGLDEAAAARELRQRAHAGLVRRSGPIGAVALERLERELDAIDAAGFHDLFLAVADIVRDVRDLGVLVACRGSAAGSLVCFALGISDVDPLLHGLAFERFMNPYRDELPDIDLDVESHRREDVYDLVIARHGEERVACVGMFETFQARSAVREVGKVLGLPAEELAHVARQLPHLRARDVRGALVRLPELAGSRLDAGRLGLLLDLVARIDGLPRHLAMHPCGILLADDQLTSRTPVQRSAHGYPVSQFDKDDIAALGFLKLDVLGVRMLSAMRHCLDLVNGVERDAGGEQTGAGRPTRLPDGGVPGWTSGPFTLDAIAHDDPVAYALIRSTHSVGMFQVESPGQRELLGRLQPTCFGDLIAEISLFRPGPMRADMVTPYVARRHGEEEVRVAHPALEGILAETFGVIVYHEQVMGVLSALTGCDLSYADLLRRRLGDPEGQRLVRSLVVERAKERGFDAAIVEQVFADVASFASFGFCKAHAAAFAVPTERSAFLKAHLFPEFMAGLITHDPGMYPRRMIVEECRLFGVAVRGPDVGRSGRTALVEVIDEDEADAHLGLLDARAAAASGLDPIPLLPAGWTWLPGAPRPSPPTGRDAGVRHAGCGGSCRESCPEADAGTRWALRLGLDGIAELGATEREQLIERRPFVSLADLRARSGLPRPAVLALCDAGALDTLAQVGSTGPCDRRALRLMVEEAWSGRTARAVRTDRAGRAGTGAQQVALELGIVEAPLDLPQQSAAARVRGELAATGVELTAHVVAFYAPLLDHLGVVGAHALRDTPTGARIRIAGVRVALQAPPQRSGQRVLFLTLDDRTGQAQVTFFERALPDCAWVVRNAWLVLAEGVVARRGERGATLIGRRAWDLARLWRAWQEGALERALTERGTPAPHERRNERHAGGTSGDPAGLVASEWGRGSRR
jgi:error-prone DNA polymerase